VALRDNEKSLEELLDYFDDVIHKEDVKKFGECLKRVAEKAKGGETWRLKLAF
jgi:hypothetical protein